MSTTRQAFTDQRIRLLVLDEKGTGLREVSFRSDLNARLDPGMPAYRIPPEWKASVKHDGRSYIVSRSVDGTSWFAADVVSCDEDNDSDEEG